MGLADVNTRESLKLRDHKVLSMAGESKLYNNKIHNIVKDRQ